MKKSIKYVKYAKIYQKLHLRIMYQITRETKNNPYVMIVRLDVNLNREVFVFVAKKSLDFIIL